MSETTRGLRRPLSRAAVYSSLQRVLGARAVWREAVDFHLRPERGERILDLGCGPAEILDLLPPVEYTGVDVSSRYVDAARRRYGERASFIVGDVRDLRLPRQEFDAVLAIGMLHHLDDADAARVGGAAAWCLRDTGRFVAVDPVFAEGQPRTARWLLSRDRGQAVRDAEGYASLLEPFFERVEITVRHDLARVPYSHAITTARVPLGGDPADE